MRKAAALFAVLMSLVLLAFWLPRALLPPEEAAGLPQKPLEFTGLFPQGEGVDIDTLITLELKDHLDPGTLEGRFRISPEVEGRLEVDGKNIHFIPSMPLDYHTRYLITITEGLRSLLGDVLEETVTLEFTTKPRPPLKIYAVGDIMLDQLTRQRLKTYDPAYPFARTRDILREGDVVFGNLESPISDRGKPLANKRYTFRALPFTAASLTDGGVNLVSLANNHILDYGREALLDTLDILDGHGIHHAGAGRNREEAHAGTILEVKGYKVGLLAYTDDYAIPVAWRRFWQAGPDTPGAALLHDRQKIRDDIRRLRSQVDVLLVSFHWGIEYTYNLTAGQRELGRLALDAGADMVLGHHPHVPQGVELYQGKPLVYSLGNFVFYPFQNAKTHDTLILEATFHQGRFTAVSLLPARGGNSQPYLPEGKERKDVLTLLGKLLAELKTPYEIRDGVIRLLLAE
jgi:poly-gamma-glutamate capsule biosynthesis protein CapA/YwtB (metallophosphatase superfamily)